ncbi:MAG TPA: ABC transporter substrate-binding protein, partial [Casimicrobiaceae bacterium]|nr:ABC transporter substrate-binding protein [Casimicrobiaceae bacterium]
VTQTNAATLAAKAATRAIPIVMTGASQPERSGIVESLARPGGNITGVTESPSSGFLVKMAQLLKEAAPRVSRLAVLGTSEWGMQELEDGLPTLGISIVRAPAVTQHEVADALTKALRAGANGLFAPATSVNDPNLDNIVRFALANRWPSIGSHPLFAPRGGLMSYGPDWIEIRKKTAIYVDKILRGAKPAELPIEQPTKFLFVLNLRTVSKLGLCFRRVCAYAPTK